MHLSSFGEMRVEVLKKSIKKYTYSSSQEINPLEYNELKFQLGKRLFQDKLLSYNSDTSCSTCHVDRFGSSDGLKNSIGVGGLYANDCPPRPETILLIFCI